MVGRPHYKPMHSSIASSILTRDSRSAPPSYAGFQNLAMIALAVSNIRLMVEDYQKYGFITTFYRFGIPKHDMEMALLLTASVPVHFFIALAIEKLASVTATRGKKAPPRKHLWRFFALLHSLNALLVISITSYTVYFEHIWHPFIGTLCECHAIIVCLKVASYALTNRDLRDSYVDSTPIPEIYVKAAYPTNLTLSNLVYFWWAPTLIYQPVYPRSPAFRPGFAIKRVLEMVGSIVLIWFFSSQYAIPTLQDSLHYFANYDWLHVGERLMKLSSVSMGVWLLGFFCLFQSYLNLLAELTRFGDRDFYRDWWNSGSVGTYWKLWNKPVYNYFQRHIYIPLLKRGYSNKTASAGVFLFSAILHEVAVGVPTRMVIGVAFMAMLLQVPLVLVTAPLEKMRGPATAIGNCIFWLSFFLGQPTAVLIYYFAWNLK
ncbi:hypothetical protein TRICI_005637 [Trichomonascus ciferrii]|uniref:O-acyltransferase n=1 Tax=Trichomonascus ciferrii TaxID=44093 RepID=A0A642USX2_9ASCO|nr:hypothetical protein TRICI_005637 [Trichomonascus ciferrii]